MVLRVIWAITGAGDRLEETFSAVRRLSSDPEVEVTVILSRDGEIVVKWYRLWRKIKQTFERVLVEKGPNKPFVAGPLQVGYYRALFVAPATGNTVAKIVHGISDSLISNCVAQAMKGGIPVFILPVDGAPGTILTKTPQGKEIRLTTRDVDVENVEKLRRMGGIQVLDDPLQISDIVETLKGASDSGGDHG